MRAPAPTIAVALIALATAGCPKPPAQSALIRSVEGVNVTTEEMRLRVQTFGYHFAGVVEVAADEIGASTDDPAIKRHALIWKTYAIPAAYNAVFQSDPLAAFMDIWVLTVQMLDYFQVGIGKDIFGEQQQMARDAARLLEQEADSVGLSIAIGGGFARGEGLADTWARDHPIENHLFIRESTTKALATAMASGGRGAVSAIGSIEERVNDISAQFSVLTETMPKQIRWQGELLVDELVGVDQLKRSVARVDTLLASLQVLATIGADAENIIARERNALITALERERSILLSEIDRQRIETLEDAIEFRIAVLDAIEEERVAVLAAVEAERLAAIEDLRTLSTDFVDHAFWRAIQLLAGLVLTLGIVGFGAVKLMGRS